MKKIKILCVIPARSGSKGIPNKNIMKFKGLPLIAWSIKHAKGSKYAKQMKIVVSTDSEEYAFIAKKYGAEVPFLRPKNISLDKSSDIDFFKHCVAHLKETEKYMSDIIVHLRPTSPNRKIKDLDNCLNLFIKNRHKYDSLRTVSVFEKSIFKSYLIKKNRLIPLFKSIGNIKEPYNECRQKLPKSYIHNGCIDIFNSSLLKKNTISGNRIFPYVINDCLDLDTLQDLE
jgi:CMP-N,N'-diacetyllegionaminic acid synthase